LQLWLREYQQESALTKATLAGHYQGLGR